MPSSVQSLWRSLRRSSAPVGIALLTLIGACGPGEFPEIDGSFSPFRVEMNIEPAGEFEEGKELTFTFSVYHETDLLTDITPELDFVGPEMGSITVAPGATPGVFVGTHTFGAQGTYTISVRFNAEGADQELQIGLPVRAPD